jgi:hypothetical protein
MCYPNELIYDGGKMKKIVLIGIMVLIFAATGLYAEKAVILKVKVQSANVRSEPDPMSPVVAQVKEGDLLESTQKVGSWYEVAVTDQNGQTISGYINSLLVDVVSEKEVTKPKVAEPEAQEKPAPQKEPAAREPIRPAKTSSRRTSGFKIMGGLALTNMSLNEYFLADYSYTKKSRTNFTGGIGYELGFSNFGLELDLMYFPNGCITEGEFLGYNVKATLWGSGFGGVLLAKVRFMPGSTPYIFAGADAGYIQSEKLKTETDGYSDETDELKNTNRTFYGLDFGAGYELAMGSFSFFLEGRYNLGLSNLIKKPQENESVKSNAINFIAGLKF